MAMTDGTTLGELATGRRFKNGMATVLVYAAFGIALIPLVWLSITVVTKGIDRFFIDENGEHNFNLDFLMQSMRGVVGGAPTGGVLHAIWGTLLITAAAAIISVPIGLMTAVYLVEYGNGRLANSVRFFVDVMTGIPSIVAGLFAYAVASIVIGPGTKTGFTGAIALSVLMIPVVVRASEEMLRLVPNELREASYALGVPKWLTVVKVVLRTAIAGLATGVTLAIARVIGETAPLLVAVGFADSMNFNIFEGRMMTLPVYIVSEWRKGDAVCNDPSVPCVPEITEYRAWAAALVLIVIVMVLNLLARLISRWFAPKTGR